MRYQAVRLRISTGLEGALAVTRHSKPKHPLRNHKAGILLTVSMITLTLLPACAGETPKPGAPLRRYTISMPGDP